jgi:PST family polysaccharide transporter
MSNPLGARQATQVRDRVATGVALIWLTTVFQRVVQVVTALLLARLLTPQDYGLVAVALIVAYFLDVVTNVQMGSAIARIDDLDQAHLDTGFTLGLLRGVLSAAVIALLARPTALLMHDHRLEAVLYAYMIPPLLIGLQNPYFSLFSRNLDFGKQSGREALAFLAAAIAGISIALVYHSYWAIVANGITAEIVRLALSHWRVPGRPGLSLSKAGEMLGFGGWITMVNTVDYINWRLDYALLGNRLGVTAVGLYNVANQLTTTITLDVVAALAQTLLPAFSTIAKDRSRVSNAYRDVQTVTLALALPIGFGISAVAPYLVPFLVGKQWVAAVPAVQILAPVTALQTMTASIEALAYTYGQGRQLLKRSIISLLWRANFMLAGFFVAGFLGVIVARAASGVGLLIYNLFLVKRLTTAPVLGQLLAGWRSIVSGAVMWLVVAVILRVPYPGTLEAGQLAANLGVQIVTGAAVYAGLHLLLWAALGRPDGAERRLYAQAVRITGAVARRLAPG